MLIKKTLLPLAAIPLALSGMLHIIAPFVGGFNNQSGPLLVIGLIYLGVAFFFRQGAYGGYRWLAWIMFFILLIGSLVAFANVFVASGLLSWLNLGIVLANCAALALLFAALWRSKT